MLMLMLMLGATFLLEVGVQRGGAAFACCCGCGGVGGARATGAVGGDNCGDFAGGCCHLCSIRCALIDALHNEIEAIQTGAIRTGAGIEIYMQYIRN